MSDRADIFYRFGRNLGVIARLSVMIAGNMSLLPDRKLDSFYMGLSVAEYRQRPLQKITSGFYEAYLLGE